MVKDKHLILRIESGLKEELEKIANQEDRTVSNLVNRILKQYIEKRERAKKRK